MGVYHLSGLGINPGAVTMPMTAIYLMHVGLVLGNERAVEFFRYSGESGEGDSKETYPGKPQALLIFTSRSD